MVMKISILTLFPKMISAFLQESILKRAIQKKIVEIEVVDLRTFAIDEYGTVDDRPYGGGAGMVMRVDVLAKAIDQVKCQMSNVKKSFQKILLTSPKGKQYNQKKALELSKLEHLVIVCGHYEGVDERVLKFVDEEVSLGDFVMTGGEVPAVAICDSVIRLLPGVLKKESATEEESFFEVSLSEIISCVGETEVLKKLKNKNVEKVKLLEYPHYTRPERFENMTVPVVLLSGNHKDIINWRLDQAYKETIIKRPDLLE